MLASPFKICAKMSMVIWTENENKIGGHQMLTEGRNCTERSIHLENMYHAFATTTAKEPDSSDSLCRSQIMQYRYGYYKLENLYVFYEGTLTLLWHCNIVTKASLIGL